MQRTLVRTIATALALLGIVSNAALAAPAEASLWKERQKAREKSTRIARLPAPALTGPAAPAARPQLSVPPQFGTVRGDAPARESAPLTVLHIQDLHLNREAQGNIAGAVQDLLTRRQADLVALEGAFGPVDLAAARGFPDRDALAGAADALLAADHISGAVRGALLARADVPLVGVDDRRLYDANVAAYRAAALRQEAERRRWDAVLARLEDRKAAVYNPALRALDEKAAAHRRGALPTGTWTETLATVVPAGPQARAYVAALALEARLDFPAMAAQRDALVARLGRRLDATSLNAMLADVIAHRTGAMAPGAFYARLEALSAAAGLSWDGSPALRAYAGYVRAADGLDAAKLAGELDAMEAAAFAKLARTEAERALVAEAAAAARTRRLIDFQLTAADWSRHAPSADPALKPFEDFYRLAEARDRAIADNLSREMKRRGARAAVVVAGGFHTGGLRARMEADGARYLTFVPAVTTVDAESGAAYLGAFTRRASDVETLFRGRKIFLAPSPTRGLGYLGGAATLAVEAQDPLRPLSQAQVRALLRPFRGEPLFERTWDVPNGATSDAGLTFTRDEGGAARLSVRRPGAAAPAMPDHIIVRPFEWAVSDPRGTGMTLPFLPDTTADAGQPRLTVVNAPDGYAPLQRSDTGDDVFFYIDPAMALSIDNDEVLVVPAGVPFDVEEWLEFSPVVLRLQPPLSRARRAKAGRAVAPSLPLAAADTPWGSIERHEIEVAPGFGYAIERVALHPRHGTLAAGIANRDPRYPSLIISGGGSVTVTRSEGGDEQVVRMGQVGYVPPAERIYFSNESRSVPAVFTRVTVIRFPYTLKTAIERAGQFVRPAGDAPASLLFLLLNSRWIRPRLVARWGEQAQVVINGLGLAWVFAEALILRSVLDTPWTLVLVAAGFAFVALHYLLDEAGEPAPRPRRAPYRNAFLQSAVFLLYAAVVSLAPGSWVAFSVAVWFHLLIDFRQIFRRALPASRPLTVIPRAGGSVETAVDITPRAPAPGEPLPSARLFSLTPARVAAVDREATLDLLLFDGGATMIQIEGQHDSHLPVPAGDLVSIPSTYTKPIAAESHGAERMMHVSLHNAAPLAGVRAGRPDAHEGTVTSYSWGTVTGHRVVTAGGQVYDLEIWRINARSAAPLRAVQETDGQPREVIVPLNAAELTVSAAGDTVAVGEGAAVYPASRGVTTLSNRSFHPAVLFRFALSRGSSVVRPYFGLNFGPQEPRRRWIGWATLAVVAAGTIALASNLAGKSERRPPAPPQAGERKGPASLLFLLLNTAGIRSRLIRRFDYSVQNWINGLGLAWVFVEAAGAYALLHFAPPLVVLAAFFAFAGIHFALERRSDDHMLSPDAPHRTAVLASMAFIAYVAGYSHGAFGFALAIVFHLLADYFRIYQPEFIGHRNLPLWARVDRTLPVPFNYRKATFAETPSGRAWVAFLSATGLLAERPLEVVTPEQAGVRRNELFSEVAVNVAPAEADWSGPEPRLKFVDMVPDYEQPVHRHDGTVQFMMFDGPATISFPTYTGDELMLEALAGELVSVTPGNYHRVFSDAGENIAMAEFTVNAFPGVTHERRARDPTGVRARIPGGRRSEPVHYSWGLAISHRVQTPDGLVYDLEMWRISPEKTAHVRPVARTPHEAREVFLVLSESTVRAADVTATRFAGKGSAVYPPSGGTLSLTNTGREPAVLFHLVPARNRTLARFFGLGSGVRHPVRRWYGWLVVAALILGAALGVALAERKLTRDRENAEKAAAFEAEPWRDRLRQRAINDLRETSPAFRTIQDRLLGLTVLNVRAGAVLHARQSIRDSAAFPTSWAYGRAVESEREALDELREARLYGEFAARMRNPERPTDRELEEVIFHAKTESDRLKPSVEAQIRQQRARLSGDAPGSLLYLALKGAGMNGTAVNAAGFAWAAVEASAMAFAFSSGLPAGLTAAAALLILHAPLNDGKLSGLQLLIFGGYALAGIASLFVPGAIWAAIALHLAADAASIFGRKAPDVDPDTARVADGVARVLLQRLAFRADVTREARALLAAGDDNLDLRRSLAVSPESAPLYRAPAFEAALGRAIRARVPGFDGILRGITIDRRQQAVFDAAMTGAPAVPMAEEMAAALDGTLNLVLLDDVSDDQNLERIAAARGAQRQAEAEGRRVRTVIAAATPEQARRLGVEHRPDYYRRGADGRLFVALAGVESIFDGSFTRLAIFNPGLPLDDAGLPANARVRAAVLFIIGALGHASATIPGGIDLILTLQRLTGTQA